MLMPMLFVTLTLAVLIDAWLGEVKRFHPLEGFGHIANAFERTLNCGGNKQQFIFGSIAWLAIVLPVPIALYVMGQLLANYSIWLVLALDVAVIYFAIGLNSLSQHGMQIYHALKANDLPLARQYCGYIVSRDTSSLSEQDISRATVESMLENSHDAVTATLICYLIGGAPLVVLHRLANTLDAMWGYKNQRFCYFGKFAARADDVLGFIPAKLTAVLYALMSGGRIKNILVNAYQQAKHYKSHNGGWVMSAGASLMKISLGGGQAMYGNKTYTSPTLGDGRLVNAQDIATSLRNVNYMVSLLLILVLFAEVLIQVS
ncbi:adenosylcobinamide-phosphate synthase CbiB [Thalassotalea marina]|uniref:Cobalamin biosynthesis protein CobD n=1 Tax=Thalassotalea marina TaxID=1673741 RepID=A0A919BBS6_9GAMM|nr:adenosylcobinamide-phosphate synthase CbiB [Thalassotalea marina]GHF77829.1 cobalamin biosynthesis protein CobD [Thalassotalea marina]